jgi:predicted Zn-ribbon and HTH transcriptional regulator
MPEIPTDAVIKHLTEKWGGDAHCPMCKASNWNVGMRVVILHELRADSDSPARVGLSIPVVPVMCTNCGNTVFVNAILLGLVPPTTDPNNIAFVPPGTQLAG